MCPRCPIRVSYIPDEQAWYAVRDHEPIRIHPLFFAMARMTIARYQAQQQARPAQ